MSAEVPAVDAAAGVHPSENSDASAEWSTFSVEWRPEWGTKKVALFLVNEENRAAIDHIRTVVTQQRGPSFGELDADARFCDLPGHKRREVRERGVSVDENPRAAPAEEVGRC